MAQKTEVMQLSGYDSTDQGTLWLGDLGENGSAKTRASLKLFFLGGGDYIYLVGINNGSINC